MLGLLSLLGKQIPREIRASVLREAPLMQFPRQQKERTDASELRLTDRQTAGLTGSCNHCTHKTIVIRTIGDSREEYSSGCRL